MIERHFLGWDEPLLPLAARFLRERYQREGVLDLRGVCVVPPGGRAGRRLEELLLDEASAHAARLVPPRMVRTGDLAELFYRPGAPVAGAFTLRRVWASVLREAGAEVVVPLLGEVPAESDVVGWDRIARRVSSIHHEVAGGGHSFLDVAVTCECSPELLHDDGARWRLFADLGSRYRRRLRSLGLADPDLERADRLRPGSPHPRAPGTGELRADTDVWLVGVTELPPVVARIVERAESPVGTLVHAPAEEADGFDALGLVMPSAWRERTLEVPDEMVRVADLPGDQAAAVLEALAELGDARTGDVVVGVPDTSLVPYVREWLESAGIPVHYAGGRKVAQTRPFRLLEALAGYLETGEWEEFAALRRHPDVEGWLVRKHGGGPLMHGPARLDEVFADHLPARVAGTGDAGLRRGGGGGHHDGNHDLDASGRVRDLVQPLERAPSIRALRERRARPLAEWPALILNVLVEAYESVSLDGHSPPHRADEIVGLGRHPPSAHELKDALEKIRGAALGLHGLPPELSPTCDAAAAIRLLIDEVRAATVPDDPEGAPIELLGWLEAVIDDAPHLIVVGVNEGRLPESSIRDAFLPDQLRGRLGIADDASRYARDAFHLLAIVRSRASVRLIAGRREAAGDPRRPSRLLLTDRGPALARRIRALAGEDPGCATLLAPILSAAGATNGFSLPPEPTLAFTSPTRFNVTGIRGILQDPYRFVLENVLGLEAKDDEARELDPLAFGSVAHEVLGQFGLSADRDSTDASLIARRLDELLDQVARKRYVGTFPAVWLQVEQLRVRLRAFAHWQANRASEGWRIVVAEGRVVSAASDTTSGGEGETSREGGESLSRTAEIPFDVDGEPITLRGRIDRIDHHPERGWAIFDYKTGDSASKPEANHVKRGEWVDAQLPLYRHLARAIRGADGEPLWLEGESVALGYIAIPRDTGALGERIADWSDQDLDQADEAVREAVRTIRRETVTFAGLPGSARWSDALGALLGSRLLAAADDVDGDPDDGAEGSRG